MVAPLKTRGLDDIRELLRRLGRLYGLNRIGTEDFLFIQKRLKEIEARIIAMREANIEEMF